MKKIIVLIMVAALAFSLCGCVNTKYFVFADYKYFKPEQSRKNFSAYRGALQKVADKYDVELKDAILPPIIPQDGISGFLLTATINENVNIEISLSCDVAGLENEGWLESFYIAYTIDTVDGESNFNIPLFVDLANCVSGVEISIRLCETFLGVSESMLQRENCSCKIHKYYPYNFWEDWMLSYTLRVRGSDEAEIFGESEMVFGGLTKQIDFSAQNSSC